MDINDNGLSKGASLIGDCLQSGDKLSAFAVVFITTFLEQLRSSNSLDEEVTFNSKDNCAYGVDIVNCDNDSTASTSVSMGPFSVSLLSDLSIQIEYFQGQKIAHNSFEITALLNKMHQERINMVVEQTAHEITRVYEYQIVMLNGLEDIHQLALYAVQHIFDRATYWLTETHRMAFTSTELINLLLQPNYDVDSLFGSLSQIMDNVYNQFLSTVITLRTTISENTVWQPYEVFEKVGLRVELLGGGCEYRTTETRLNPKCGFRSQFYEFDDHITRSFTSSVADAAYTVLARDMNEQRAVPYDPMNRIVFQEEIDLYVHNLSSSNSDASKDRDCTTSAFHTETDEVLSFVDYFKIINNIDASHDICPVFRIAQLCGDITGSDFSHCDLSSVHLEGITANQCNFDNARLLGAYIECSDLCGSTFNHTDLRYAQLYSVDLSHNNTVLTTCDLRYSVLGLHSDLSANFTLPLTSLVACHIIMTDLFPPTLLTRLKNIPVRDVKLECEMNTMQSIQERAVLAAQINNHSHHKNSNTRKSNNNNSLNNLPSHSSHFVGRTDQLSQAHNYLNNKECCSDDDCDEHHAAVVVVTGDRGVGKTEFMLQYYAHYNKKHSDNKLYQSSQQQVFWFDATNTNTITHSFYTLAVALQIDITTINNTTDIITAVYATLQSPLTSSTLLLFDNVVSRQFITPYLPPHTNNNNNNNCHVMIASCDCDSWFDDDFVLHLNTFTECEAVMFVQNTLHCFARGSAHKHTSSLHSSTKSVSSNSITTSENTSYTTSTKTITPTSITGLHDTEYSNTNDTKLTSQITILTTQFNNHTRALSLCVSFINNNNITISEFMDYFTTYHTKINIANNTNNTNNIDNLCFTLYSIILDDLRDMCSASVDILKLCAFLHCECISEALFDWLFVNMESEQLRTITALKISNLVSIHNNTSDGRRVITMHNHVCEFIRLKFSNETDDLFSTAVELVLHTMQANNTNNTTELNTAYLIHADSLFAQYHKITHKQQLSALCNNDFTEEDTSLRNTTTQITTDITTLYVLCGNLYSELGLHTTSLEMHTSALDLLEETEFSSLLSDCLYGRGVALFALNKHVEAVDDFTQCVSVREHLSGTRNHLSVCIPLWALACVHLDLQEYALSITQYEEVLRIRIALLGRWHILVADTLTDISRISSMQGELEEAVRGHGMALCIYTALLGYECVEVAQSLCCIAEVLVLQGGDTARAGETFSDALDIVESVLETDSLTDCESNEKRQKALCALRDRIMTQMEQCDLETAFDDDDDFLSEEDEDAEN